MPAEAAVVEMGAFAWFVRAAFAFDMDLLSGGGHDAQVDALQLREERVRGAGGLWRAIQGGAQRFGDAAGGFAQIREAHVPADALQRVRGAERLFAVARGQRGTQVVVGGVLKKVDQELLDALIREDPRADVRQVAPGAFIESLK